MKIRPASTKDAHAISTLISSVVHYFTLDPQGIGAEDFFETIRPSSIAEYIADSNVLYFTAFIDNELAGVVAIRDNEHLLHLFVAHKFQQQGIAKELWTFAMEAAIRAGNKSGFFTVNSTEYAVPVYERFGFKATGQRVEANGIAFVPMKLTIDKEVANKANAADS